jgi:hypothetical protein
MFKADLVTTFDMYRWRTHTNAPNMVPRLDESGDLPSSLPLPSQNERLSGLQACAATILHDVSERSAVYHVDYQEDFCSSESKEASQNPNFVSIHVCSNWFRSHNNVRTTNV